MNTATRPLADPDEHVRQLVSDILAAGQHIPFPSPDHADLAVFENMTARGLTLAQAVARSGEIIRRNDLTQALAELPATDHWNKLAVFVIRIAAEGDDATTRVNTLAEEDADELARALRWATNALSLCWPAPPAGEVEKVRAVVRREDTANLNAKVLKRVLLNLPDRDRVRYLINLAGEERPEDVPAEERAAGKKPKKSGASG